LYQWYVPKPIPDDDDVYLIKSQREVLQNLWSAHTKNADQPNGISKENTHENSKATDITEQPSDKIIKTLHT
jgi:hypothetical protein